MIFVNIYLDVIINKLKSFVNRQRAFSAVIFNSRIDNTSVIRQKCRFYNSSLDRYSYVRYNLLVQNTEIGQFCSISESCNIRMPAHPTNMVSSSPVFLEGKNCLRKNFQKIISNRHLRLS